MFFLFTTRLKKRAVLPLDESSLEDRSFLSRKALPPALMAFFTHIIWGALTAFFPLYALDHGVSNPGFSVWHALPRPRSDILHPEWYDEHRDRGLEVRRSGLCRHGKTDVIFDTSGKSAGNITLLFLQLQSFFVNHLQYDRGKQDGNGYNYERS